MLDSKVCFKNETENLIDFVCKNYPTPQIFQKSSGKKKQTVHKVMVHVMVRDLVLLPQPHIKDIHHVIGRMSP